MKPARETILPGAGSSFVCLDIDQSEFDCHYHHHPEFELTWILESEGQRLVGDSVEGFGPGDLVLIGRWVPHQYRNWQRGKRGPESSSFGVKCWGMIFCPYRRFQI